MTAAEAWAQAKAEGLTLLRADNQTGFYGVKMQNSRSKPFRPAIKRTVDGVTKNIYLGLFATAEEAALHYARTPEGKERIAWEESRKAAIVEPLTASEALAQAEAEGLELVRYANGQYVGVTWRPYRLARQYAARATRGNVTVSLGFFETPEEAALVHARWTEGRTPRRNGHFQSNRSRPAGSWAERQATKRAAREEEERRAAAAAAAAALAARDPDAKLTRAAAAAAAAATAGFAAVAHAPDTAPSASVVADLSPAETLVRGHALFASRRRPERAAPPKRRRPRSPRAIFEALHRLAYGEPASWPAEAVVLWQTPGFGCELEDLCA